MLELLWTFNHQRHRWHVVNLRKLGLLRVSVKDQVASFPLARASGLLAGRHLEEVDELSFVDHPGGEAALVRRLVDDHRVLHVVARWKSN